MEFLYNIGKILTQYFGIGIGISVILKFLLYDFFRKSKYKLSAISGRITEARDKCEADICNVSNSIDALKSLNNFNYDRLAVLQALVDKRKWQLEELKKVGEIDDIVNAERDIVRTKIHCFLAYGFVYLIVWISCFESLPNPELAGEIPIWFLKLFASPENLIGSFHLLSIPVLIRLFKDNYRDYSKFKLLPILMATSIAFAISLGMQTLIPELGLAFVGSKFSLMIFLAGTIIGAIVFVLYGPYLLVNKKIPLWEKIVLTVCSGDDQSLSLGNEVNEHVTAKSPIDFVETADKMLQSLGNKVPTMLNYGFGVQELSDKPLHSAVPSYEQKEIGKSTGERRASFKQGRSARLPNTIDTRNHRLYKYTMADTELPGQRWWVKG